MYGQTNHIDQIALTYNPNYDLTEALAFSDRLENVFRRRFKIAPKDQSGIRIFNYAEVFEDISNFTGGLDIAVIIVGLLILLSGIVGIGNIMVFIIKGNLWFK